MVLDATVKVALEDPDPPLMGLVPKATVTPEGIPDAVRVTDELKPFDGVAVIVEFPLAPAATEREDGEAESAKDGWVDVVPVRASIRPVLGLPHPVTRSKPATAE